MGKKKTTTKGCSLGMLFEHRSFFPFVTGEARILLAMVPGTVLTAAHAFGGDAIYN